MTTKTYNNRYQLNNLSIGTLKQLSYSRDNIGNITGITDTLNPSNTKSYTYDNIHRLTLATGSWGAITYAYDSVSNRTYETTDTGNTTYTYTTNTNKLASTSGEKVFNFNFDNNGNTTSENTRQYIYNQNQRLIKAMDGSNVLGEYIYNGNGQRADKLIPSQNKCTVFHYDKNGLLISESTRTGNIKAEYVYLDGQPLAKIENNNIYYYHDDHLGTPMVMTDNSGSVVWQGEYLPFGEPLSITGTITNNLRFPGQYYDSETGLHQNYFRDYYDKFGRYIEADPIGIEEGTNHLYVYTDGNPINFIDLTGFATCTYTKTTGRNGVLECTFEDKCCKKFSSPAYSGNGKEKSEKKFGGPIPNGNRKIYTPGWVSKHPKWAYLKPIGHDAYGRKEFFIHGDGPKNNGCISVKNKFNVLIDCLKKDKGGTLTVK